MKTSRLIKTALIILFGLIFWNYFSGISSVPFHPDESTQIFMSSDAATNPINLAYEPSQVLDNRTRYRLIDSPITRLLIGWGLVLLGEKNNPADWNWAASWDENVSAGALPSDSALQTARLSVAWLFPFSCLFLFLLAKKLSGTPIAVLTAILFSTNALVLIHTRRAMAESALICTFCALVWILVDDKKTVWISSLAAGLAINSKQTTFPVVFIGFLTTYLLPLNTNLWKKIARAGLFLILILVISGLLNPVFWKHPLDAIREGTAQRADLSSRMREDYRTSMDFFEQTIFLVAHTFIQPPAIADVLNYQDETLEAERNYLREPFNNLFRGFAGGSIMLFLTIAGWIIFVKQAAAKIYVEWIRLLIFTAITIASIFSLMMFTAAPFQRYYIILVPLFSISQATALLFLGSAAVDGIKKWVTWKGNP